MILQMILEAVAPSKLPIQLDMIRPMNAQNTVEFTLAFNRGATDATWSMKGKKCLWNSPVKGLPRIGFLERDSRGGVR